MIKGFLLSVAFVVSMGMYAQDTTHIDTNDTLSLGTSDSLQAYRQPPMADREGPMYKLKPAVDIPLTLIAGGWSGFAFTKIYSKDAIPASDVLALRKENVNGFDRRAAGNTSVKAADNSDILFYGSMPAPLLLLLDKHVRKEAGKVGFLYLQAMSVTGLLYTGSTFLVDRYRPETYNTSLPLDERRDGGNKNSFFAGHVALVGTSTFFMAKVLSDYHPESNLKWLYFGTAALATGATGYLRLRAGKHFPSDVLIGTAVGTLSGILVPHFHKNKIFKDPSLTIMPFTGRSHGLAMVYRFK